jgi:thiaminase/transcriptional activator TenA
MTSFTGSLWESIAPIYSAILDQPFIDELTRGTLSRERFVFYMKQDALYLRDFSRALALTGVRAEEPGHLQAMLDFARNAAAVEITLHETYLHEFGTTIDVEQSPSCFAYTKHLLATATTAPFSEAAAALLPCFWIYQQVGTEIFERGRAGLSTNPYARWIEQYSGEAFAASAARAIALVESVAQRAPAHELEGMRRAFVLSSRLEWMFWESAYRLEPWRP